MCIIAWLKRRPNILVWLILHGLGQIAMIIKTIGIIIFTKYIYGKDHMCFVKDIWKTNENAWNITLYQGWPRWLFIDGVLISFCGGKFLCMFISNGVSTSSRSPSKNSHTHACVKYAISIDILFVLPCFSLGVHNKSTFEKNDITTLCTWIDCDLSHAWVTVCLSVSKMIKVLQSFGILKYHKI